MNGIYKVDLRSVVHGYGNKVVLDGVDLRVRPREILSIVGPSGCGKSTLFRIILGEERPRSGIVEVDGKPKEGPGPDVGVVYQQYTLFPHLTVFQNVAYGPTVRDTSIPERLLWRMSSRNRRIVAEVKERTRHYLDMVKLGDAGDKYPHELSGGMQQRVAIAQALTMNPSVILMDEPFGALDTFTREELQMDLVRLWKETDMTILFVTHDLEEAVFVGTRIAVLSQHYRSSDPAHNGGSKIVMDLPIPMAQPRPAEFKESPDLNAILERVRRNPALHNTPGEGDLQVNQFALEHPDSIPVA